MSKFKVGDIVKYINKDCATKKLLNQIAVIKHIKHIDHRMSGIMVVVEWKNVYYMSDCMNVFNENVFELVKPCTACENWKVCIHE